MRISLSSEYQSPKPRPPTLRLPMALTSALLPSCLTLVSSGCWTTGGIFSLSLAALPDAGAWSFAVSFADVSFAADVSLGATVSLAVVSLVAVSGAGFGAGSCWQNAEEANSNADKTAVPNMRRNFMTHSCPGPGPHTTKIIRPLATGIANVSDHLDAENQVGVIQ